MEIQNIHQQNMDYANVIAVDDSIIERVFNRLKYTPYLPASEIALRENLSSQQINLAYESIQTSDRLQNELKKSCNRDYFDTVKNHFGKRQYTVVFFVGLYCPARCHFCPSVKVHADGYRELFRFKSQERGRQKLSYFDIERTFTDLDRMQRMGTAANIKISGGLEPFTDPRTIGWILELSRKYGINSTIFTNGMLLKLEKNQKLALQCDNLRISLSTVDDNSYNNAYFGSHEKNKKVATLRDLISSLKKLVRLRNESGSKTKIGINVVAGEFNFNELEAVVVLMADIGVDYVEVKGEYFEEKNADWFDSLECVLSRISGCLVNGRIKNTVVNLTGSLERNNFFNNIPDGYCLPEDQAAHKLFVNPFGESTPLHCWAYPEDGAKISSDNFLGVINGEFNLFELISQSSQLPKLHFADLNPFELILSLESARMRSDAEFGIDSRNNPYLPRDIFENHPGNADEYEKTRYSIC